MCSQFELKMHPSDPNWGFDLDELPDGFTRGEIRPTNQTLCLGPRGLFINRWGLKVNWGNKPIINARAETLRVKPTFQPLLNFRCLVPASAYFEWRREGSQRFKNRIAISDTPQFTFAGLTDGENVTIVTCQSVPSVAHIHARMPVILSSINQMVWIDDEREYADVAHLVLPRDDLDLEVDEKPPQPPRQDDLFV